MKSLSIIGLLLAGLCLLVVLSASPAQSQVPSTPHAFYGAVEVDGQSAPIGTQIEARGSGVLFGVGSNPVTTTQAGMYGGPGGFDPKLVVQGTIADGTPLEFYVDGVRAQCAQPGGAWSDTFPFAAGGITELNLRVLGPTPTETPTNTPTSTPTSTPSPTSTPTRFRSSARWVAAYGTTAGGWSTQDKYPRHVADVNGDGLADVVGFGDAGPYVSLSTGSSFGASNRWGTGYGYVTGGWTSQNLYPRFLADVNKDGKADVVGFGKYGAYVSLSTGSSFGASTRWLAKFGTAQGWTSQDKNPRMLGDVNGDGRADVVGFGNDGVYVSLSTGTSFGTPTRWIVGYGYSAGGWTSQDRYPRCVADVDGDGKADVVGFGNAGAYVSSSTGSSFGASTRWVSKFGYNAGGWTSQNLYPRMLADTNADNRADIIGFSKYGAYVSLSTGASFAAPVLGIADFGISAGGWSSQNTYPRTVADVNHDYKADIVGFASGGTYVSLSQW